MTAVIQLTTLPLVHALGWTLLNFCWQGTIVAFILACTLGLLPSRASRARYSIACAALALMVMLPAITFYMLAANTQPKPPRFAVAVAVEGFSHLLNNRFNLSAEPWTVRTRENSQPIAACGDWVLVRWHASPTVPSQPRPHWDEEDEVLRCGVSVGGDCARVARSSHRARD